MRHSEGMLALLLALSAAAHAGETRPWAEYEPVRRLVLSAGFDYQTENLKRALLAALPEDVQVIAYESDERALRLFQEAFPGRKNLRVERIRKAGEKLWPRDSWPFPLIENGELSLSGTRYPQHFDPNEEAASLLGAPLRRHDIVFENGNVNANRLGDCLIVQDNFAGQLSDGALMKAYACRTLLRLPWIAGIGHVDEVAKFVADGVVLTDQPAYVEALKARGWRVVLLPQAKLPPELGRRGVMPQRNYLNSVLVNGTAIVPSFGLEADAEAAAVYRALGFEVVSIDSRYASDYGGGGLHCLTATYP